MNKLPAIAVLAAASLGLQTTAFGYAATANLTFSWGGANSTDIGWTASGGTAVLAPFTNASYLTTYTGNNSTNYYNTDFATTAGCLAVLDAFVPGYTAAVTKKYGCAYTDPVSGPSFFGLPDPPTGTGPGASASGTLSVTDTTMTGTLTILGTTDLATGGTATNLLGANGYNLRQADGSPFGNSWGGVTTLGTYTVNLTGVFTETSWQITGGGARFSDAGYLCQQGGNSSPANILCRPSSAPGGFTTTGGSLSWGWEVDGAASNLGNVVAGIDVRDQNNVLITTLSGVLADMSIDGAGNITTNSGEIRRALGSAAGCGQGTDVKNITYNAGLNTITCGTLSVANLVISGFPSWDPDPFTFVAQVNVPLSTVITSNTITVTGASSTKNISVANGEYALGCTGAFTQAPGTIAPGGTVCVRQTSSALPGTATTTTLTIGGSSGQFRVTTIPADTTPDSFTFLDQANVDLSTVVISASATITGINAPAPISVAGGEYSIGCSGTFTAAPGTISNNQSVCVRQTSAAAPATSTTTTLTIGGVSGGFTVTTFPADNTPEAFAFIDQTNVALATATTSSPVTITGVNTGTPISAFAGQYSIGCTGTFTSAPSTISNNQTVCVRQTSSPAPDTTTDTVLTIGGVSDTFSVTTVPADTTPDPFTFVDRVDVQEGTVITSAPVTITGINTPAPISVLGGTYSIGCGATFTGVAGSIPNGASVCVRHTSAISQTTETSTTLTIGGVSDTFTSTTVLTFATRNDSATTLVNTPVQINVLGNDVGYSNPVTVSISTPPTGGTAVVTGSPGVQAGVRITYTPAVGFQGIDSFVYAVEDNALSGTATVTVTVTSDADGDGILDSVDNCLGVSNANQRDTNGDGYGNICDPDFNNNGIVDSQDGALLKARFGSTTHPDQDLNGNGIVDSNDGARLKAKFGKAPGPSGLAP